MNNHEYIVYFRRLVVRAIEDVIVLGGMCLGIRVLAEGVHLGVQQARRPLVTFSVWKIGRNHTFHR